MTDVLSAVVGGGSAPGAPSSTNLVTAPARSCTPAASTASW
jgi:hypothetical protein